jgi:hypothetical protein
MTDLLQLRFPLSHGKAEFYRLTELSSRPERSVVERPAVSFFALGAYFNSPAVLADRSQQAGMAFHDGQELRRVR